MFTYERAPGSEEFVPLVLHTDGVALVTPENPAKPNEVLVIYATGSGRLLNGPVTGNPAPAPPIDWLTDVLPAAIYSTNQASSTLIVQYSGLAAGHVGLWQLNIRMPPSVPAGDNGALRITLAGSFQSIQFPFVP